MAERKLDVVIRAKDLYSKVMTRAQRMAGGVGKAFALMGRALAKVRKIALLTTAAIAGLGFGMFKLVSSTAKAGDEMQKMALRTGLSAQALSEFKHAAEISGTTLETFEKGMKTLSKRISDARFGLQTYVRIFEQLGVAYQTTSGELREVDDVFMDSIAAINQLGSETEKAALAQELFGKAGTQLLPMIKAGTTEISKLREEARRLGITFDDVSANQSAEFVDALTRLKSGFRGIFNIVGKELIPVFTLWATTATTKIQELLADGTIDIWATRIKGAVEAIARSIVTLGKAFGVFMRFFGVETRSNLEIVNDEIARWEERQRAGIVSLEDGSAAARVYNDLLAERIRLEMELKGIKVIDIEGGAGGGQAVGTPFAAAQGPAAISAEGGEEVLQDALGPTTFGMTTRLQEIATFHDQKIQAMIDAGKSSNDIAMQVARAELEIVEQQEQMKAQLRRNGLSMAASFMGNLLTMTGNNSKKMFKMQQLFSIGQAVISGYHSAVLAWQAGMSTGGPWAPAIAVAYTAMSLAKTGALIASIKSQKMGGGGTTSNVGGGGSVAAGGFNTGAQPVPLRTTQPTQAAQQVTLIINNPLSDQNWAEIAENNIIPAINDAAERNINITVREVAA